MRLSGLLCLLALLGCLFVSCVSGADYGWDTSSLRNQTVMNCLKQLEPTSFMVFTAFSSNKPSDTVCDSLQFAEDNHIAHKDVKFYPCPTCSASAADQIEAMLAYLNKHCDSLWSKRVWLDMNSHSLWSTPWREPGWRKNQEWFNDMIDACVSQSGISCGIYSSADEWGYTLGSKSYSYAPATKLPLWFKQDDGVEDFSGFVPFGGFTSPVAKQFRSSYSLCGTSTTIGENWAPEW